MACFSLLAASPLDPDGGQFVPRAISADGGFVYGLNAVTSPTKVQKFTWPTLTFDSTYATAAVIDVIVDGAGNVYHSVTTSSTRIDVYKNGSAFANFSNAGGITGGGLAWTPGWIWTLTSTVAGSGVGILWRVDDTTTAATTQHILNPGRFRFRPHAATDGAVWYKKSTDDILYRHLSGSTSSVSLSGSDGLTPRPAGTMLVPRTSAPTGYVDVDTGMNIVVASCDPSLVGASPNPVSTFINPTVTDVALMDQAYDIYRIGAAVSGWTVGRVSWGSRGAWH